MKINNCKQLNINGSIRCCLVVIGALVTICLLAACNDNEDNDSKSKSVVEMLSEDSIGAFARAYRTRKFNFPEDYAAHPQYKHEWWYFTGNLQSSGGRRYGYELTIFRIGLVPHAGELLESDVPASAMNSGASAKSAWRSNQIYMANFALTDVEQKKFFQAERFSRDAMGLAGAKIVFKERVDNDATQLNVWLENWTIRSRNDSVFPLHLSANEENFSIDLILEKTKDVVLQGDEGLSRKGDKPGNASYYYSIPRLNTQGTIKVEGQVFSVQGISWMDREWSTSALDKNQKGWDWFAVQLDDERDIMFYRLRSKDNGTDPNSRGVIVHKDGKVTQLFYQDIDITVLEKWKSPNSEITYPIRWKVVVPRENIVFELVPVMQDQELNLTVRYWEGAVDAILPQGDANAKPKRIGVGYVELTGYS